MYVSPAVRAMRDHPVAGEPVRLLVRHDPEVDADVAAAVAAVDGSVVDELRFGGREVAVDQDRVGELLADLADRPVDAVETTDVVAPGDAGEDVGGGD